MTSHTLHISILALLSLTFTYCGNCSNNSASQQPLPSAPTPTITFKPVLTTDKPTLVNETKVIFYIKNEGTKNIDLQKLAVNLSIKDAQDATHQSITGINLKHFTANKANTINFFSEKKSRSVYEFTSKKELAPGEQVAIQTEMANSKIAYAKVVCELIDATDNNKIVDTKTIEVKFEEVSLEYNIDNDKITFKPNRKGTLIRITVPVDFKNTSTIPVEINELNHAVKVISTGTKHNTTLIDVLKFNIYSLQKKKITLAPNESKTVDFTFGNNTNNTIIDALVNGQQLSFSLVSTSTKTNKEVGKLQNHIIKTGPMIGESNLSIELDGEVTILQDNHAAKTRYTVNFPLKITNIAGPILNNTQFLCWCIWKYTDGSEDNSWNEVHISASNFRLLGHNESVTYNCVKYYDTTENNTQPGISNINDFKNYLISNKTGIIFNVTDTNNPGYHSFCITNTVKPTFK